MSTEDFQRLVGLYFSRRREIMIEYHNPEASVGIDNQPYGLSLAVTGTNAVNLGFLANGFPDSVNFLNELQAAIQDLEPGIEAHAYNKGNASVAASDQLLGEIGGECQGVIAAYGH